MRQDLYAFDIETTGLNPSEDVVRSIAVCSHAATVVWENANERELLDDFHHWLTSRTPGTLISWNGSGFDIPFLMSRAAATGSPLGRILVARTVPSRSPQYGPLAGHDGGYILAAAGWDHIDAMLPWRDISQRDGLRYNLKAVARRNNIDVIEVDRTAIADLSAAELAAYNVSDVAATLTLAERLGDELDEWRDDLEWRLQTL